MASECVYGIHAVQALLESEPKRLLELLLLQQRDDPRLRQVEQLAEVEGVRISRVKREKLDELAANGHHQGVVALCTPRQTLQEKDLPALIEAIDGNALLLLLDGVTDPHNLGACLRSAEAAGVHAVIIPKDKSAELTPLVRKVASGAAEFVPLVRVTNLARCMGELQALGVWLVGLAGEAEQNLYSLDLSGPAGLVLGAEGAGLRRLTRDKCDYLARIPMHGKVSSLNVSVTAGVCLFEALRQRDVISP